MVTLYDAYGRPISRSQVRRKEELDRYYVDNILARDYVGTNLTAAKLASILREADEGQPGRMQELFDDMEDRDTHLMSQVQKRVMTIINRDMQVVPADSSAKAKTAADFCRELLLNIPDFTDVLIELSKAVYRGYTLAEILWDFSGDTVIKEIRPEDPRAFVPDELNPRVLRRLTQADPIKGEILAPAKWIQHHYRAKSGLPVRAGLGRVCSWYFLFKQYSIKDWLEFAEIFGSPPRLGFYPPGIQDEDRQVLERAVRLFSHDLAALLPEGTRIEFPQIKAPSASVDLYDRMVERCNAEESKAVLGQTLTTEQGTRGARSLGEVHEQAELRLVRGDAKALVSTIRRDILHPAVQFQFGDTYPVPKVEIDVEDIDELVGRIEKLVGLGLPVGRSFLYSRMGIPAPSEGEEVVGGSSAAMKALEDKVETLSMFVGAGKKKAMSHEEMAGYL